MLRGILISAVLIPIGIAFQILIAHIFQPKKLFNLAATIFLLSLPVYGAAYFYFPEAGHVLWWQIELPAHPIGFINGFIVHLFLFLNYVQCLYYFSRPVTLRVVIEFFQAKGQALTISELQHRYNLKKMIESRLSLLTLHCYLVQRGIGYELTRKGKIFAALFLFLRRFFGVPYYLGTSYNDTR